MTDTTIDPATLETTIDTYFATWNELDPDRRAALCQQVWAPDGRYADPLLDATGPQAIADGLGALQAQLPGHTVVRSTALDVHHDMARFGWQVTAPDGSVAVAGIDVATVADDGRLASVTGFFGDLAAS
jgi:hypothetical protein